MENRGYSPRRVKVQLHNKVQTMNPFFVSDTSTRVLNLIVGTAKQSNIWDEIHKHNYA